MKDEEVKDKVVKISTVLFGCNGSKGLVNKMDEMYEYIIVKKELEKKNKFWIAYLLFPILLLLVNVACKIIFKI